MSVSFTDKAKDVMTAQGYEAGQSELGYVYYPRERIKIPGSIAVNYEMYPWITCFEVEGIEILKNQPVYLNSATGACKEKSVNTNLL